LLAGYTKTRRAIRMNSAFDELLNAARQLGMTIRSVHLGGAGGGVAQFKGQAQLFIDLDCDAAEQLAQTAQALCDDPRMETLFIRPDVRQLLDDYRQKPPTKKAPSPEGGD
jgi:hypothetical protein